MLAQSSLARWLRRQSGPLPIPRVVDLVRQAAVAIQELHNQQIIHQDINPTSFLVQETGAGHLELRLVTPDTKELTATPLNNIFPWNSMLTYMAPEQWTGHSTPATDQYALAVLTYELLTGVPPFQGPPAQLLDSHMKAQPPVPSSIRPQVTPAFDSVLMNALAKRPEDRFPSVTAFGNALFQALRVPGSMIVNVPDTTTTGSLHAMLYISNTEALVGTLRTLILPQGKRVVIAIPKDTYDGQVIRIDHYDASLPKDGSQVPVMLTIVVTPTETSIPAVHITQPKQPAAEVRVEGPVTPFLPSIQTLLPTWGNILATFTHFSLKRKVALLALLASLLLLLILGGVGTYSLLQPNVPMPYPPNSGTLALNDPLHDNSQGYNWPDAASMSNGGICAFSQGAYHVLITKQGAFHYCIAGSTGYGNFAYEVRMTILRGDSGGLVFRADGNKNRFYYFRITQDGFYGLYLYSDTQATHAKTLAIGRAGAIHTGLNIPNVLAIVTHDSNINLYVNTQLITSITDSNYTSGQIGVAATYDTLATEVAFNNAKVWTI